MSHRLKRIFFTVVLAVAVTFEIAAQSSPRFYYAIENLSDGSVVRRGQTTSQGIPENELILAANTDFRAWLFNADTGLVGFREFQTPDSGQRFHIPSILMGVPRTPDSDGDGLADEVEFVVGTNPLNPDTDGDGIKDGTAIRLGLDPGAAARTGIIASTDTPGTAVDVAALNDLVVVADSDKGITLFDVSERNSARIMAQVDTPGNAVAVAITDKFVAAADSAAGLAIVDISKPSQSAIVHQIKLGDGAFAVAANGGIAYVGARVGGNSTVYSVDLATGTVIASRDISGSVQDVGIGGNAVYVVTPGRLSAVPLDDLANGAIAQVTFPATSAAGGRRLRLFVGGDRAYVTHASGYAVIGLQKPLEPQFIRNNDVRQFGWKQMVATGSGLGLAAADAVSSDAAANDVDLYTIGTGDAAGKFVTTFPTPGIATAVCIYNGLAYVADAKNGLQVINFAPFDTGTNSPSISLQFDQNLTQGGIEEGKPIQVTANATDDVLVRNVEFYVDGVKVSTDGNFPFGFQFVAPRRASEASFTFQARATDSGGNSRFSELYRVPILPDTTPPLVKSTAPRTKTVVADSGPVFLYFSEPINANSLGGTNVVVDFAGDDSKWGTLDDSRVANVTVNWRDTINAAVLSFAGPLPAGLYRVSANSGVIDIAGNSLNPPYTSTFWVLPGGPDADADGDGLSNGDEAARGTNPLNPDSDGDLWSDSAEVDEGTDPLDRSSYPKAVYVARPPVQMLRPVTGGDFSVAVAKCKRRLKSEAGVTCVTGRSKIAAASLTMKHVSQYGRLERDSQTGVS